jgi:hypothetical protein
LIRRNGTATTPALPVAAMANSVAGLATVFTPRPRLRLISNIDHPAVDAGYALMATAGRLIAEKAEALGTRLVFTVMPAGERVYADMVIGDSIVAAVTGQRGVLSSRMRTRAAGPSIPPDFA